MLVEKSSTTNTGLRSMRTPEPEGVLNQSANAGSINGAGGWSLGFLSGHFGSDFVHVESFELLNEVS